MSQYKTAIHPQQPSDRPEKFKYPDQLRQLRELFPSWTEEDLKTLLLEVDGDVQTSANRITDGIAEQWGEVTHKKDKKTQVAGHTSKDSFSGRGDSRGTRGGRGGRGGPGRGGARGRGGVPRGGATNGHVSRTSTPKPTGVSADPDSAAPLQQTSGDGHQELKAAGDLGATTRPTDRRTDAAQSHPEHTEVPKTQKEPGDFQPQNGVLVTSTGLAASSTAKSAAIPATAKRSWAQIARQTPEKPPAPSTPAHPPAHAHPPPPHAQAQPAALATSAPAPPAPVQGATPSEALPSTLPEEGTSPAGWEEPTTVEPPTWEDESSKPQVSVQEAWPASLPEEVTESTKDAPKEQTAEVAERPAPIASEPAPAQEAPAEVPVVSAIPMQPQQPVATATPSPKLTARPSSVAHRARFRVTDQAVVMPGSFGPGIEKIGMQFGSLSLNGDTLTESTPVQAETSAPSPPPAAQQVQEKAPVPTAPAPTSVPVQAPAPAPAPTTTAPPAPLAPPAAPVTSTALAPAPTVPAVQVPISPAVFQQQPNQAPVSAPAQPSQHITSQNSAVQGSLTSTQPSHAQVSHTAASAVAASPLQPFTPQAVSHHTTPSSQHHQHQPVPPHAHQSHSHHQYSQHSLSAHVDPTQSTPTTSQPQQPTSHTSYFRQNDVNNSAYFHTPTPPATQSQDATYGAFGQLAGQAQHQQASHVSGFGASDYSYGDNQRGFYDNYSQQTGFGGRNVLGHEDAKGLPSATQPSTGAGLPTSTQVSQQHPSSQANQPQSAGGQAPQQGYPPPPVPYYYTQPYPHNQYYGSPYSSGYVPQPFVKYPTMFQPGPPGPGSAPSPAGKQPGANVGVNVQPQSNPYSQGLYQQGGYDDYQHPHHTQHQQHQHGHSLGLGQGVGASEYGKQLYGGSGQGGMQGFMNLGQNAGASGVPTSNNSGPRGGSSPENTFKPYASKDVGVGVGSGRGVQQQGGPSQQPQQGQSQSAAGPQGQFYGGNRFGSNVGGSVGVPQQSVHHQQQGGPQGHLGYPQTGNDSFYQYQARQQQGYWQ